MTDLRSTQLPQPYYEDEYVTIYNADNRDIIPQLSDIDMVFTSPPYNLGTTTGGGVGIWSVAAKDLQNGYRTYSDDMPQNEYDTWQTETVSALWRTLTETGAIFYNHKPRVQNGISKLPTEYGIGLPLRQIITWDRGTGMNFSRSFFLPKTEWIVIWAKPAFQLISKSAAQIGDIWHIPPEQDTKHPAPFPLALPTKAINATNAETILDPFAGSGTTLIAARNLGRKAIGIEMDERYCKIASTRLAQTALIF